MKICIIGGGFTATVAAIAIKKNCPHVNITMIDSDTEPKNLFFGESAPPLFMNWVSQAFKIQPGIELLDWITECLVETRSTLKYNLLWKDFTAIGDQGFVSGIRDNPDYRAIFNTSNGSMRGNPEIMIPDHTNYRLSDIWYELYMQGRRQLSDFGPDVNDLHWTAVNNKVNFVENSWVNQHLSMHINSFEFGDWLKKKYASLIQERIIATVTDINVGDNGDITSLMLNTGQQVQADLYLDCTGFKRLLGKKFKLDWMPVSTQIYHNSAVITASRYDQDIDNQLVPYTIGTAMEAGWSFKVPLLDRHSFGYVFNSADISADQAVDEMMQGHVDEKKQMVDPFVIKWEPGCYYETRRNNYALMGLASGFGDAFDANTIALQFLQIFRLIREIGQNQTVLKMPLSKSDYNESTRNLINFVAERLELHQGLAPRNTSEYWRRNKQIAIECDLENKIFDVLSDYRHTPRAVERGDFVPYQDHLYFSESIYYGLDMSRRCRNSSPELLDLAYKFFTMNNELSQAKAHMLPSVIEWYASRGIDVRKINSLE